MGPGWHSPRTSPLHSIKWRTPCVSMESQCYALVQTGFASCWVWPKHQMVRILSPCTRGRASLPVLLQTQTPATAAPCSTTSNDSMLMLMCPTYACVLQPLDSYWMREEVCLLPVGYGGSIQTCGAPLVTQLKTSDGAVAGRVTIFQTVEWLLFVTYQVRAPEGTSHEGDRKHT